MVSTHSCVLALRNDVSGLLPICLSLCFFTERVCGWWGPKDVVLMSCLVCRGTRRSDLWDRNASHVALNICLSCRRRNSWCLKAPWGAMLKPLVDSQRMTSAFCLVDWTTPDRA